MALTQGHDLYAAFHENGIHKFLHSLFLARPHYFTYATSSLGGGTDDVSILSPLPVPGSNATIEFSLQFTEPEILFFPLANPGTFPLPVSKDQFGLHVKVTICLVSSGHTLQLRVNRLIQAGVLKARPPQSICGSFDIWCVGNPTIQDSGQGKLIGLVVDDIKVDGAGNLNAVLQYIGQLALNALLAKIQFPASALAQGAFTFAVEQGPEISDNQLKVWAGIV